MATKVKLNPDDVRRDAVSVTATLKVLALQLQDTLNALTTMETDRSARD